MTQPGIENVDPQSAQAMLREGAFLLDVRQPEEFTAGHAPEAVLVPLDQLGARQDEIPTDQPIVVVCRSGGRSAKAAEALVNAGYEAVNLAGGMKAWSEEGKPFVADDGTPGVVA
jgi:rhodanese-related sulfurtransferase